MSIFPFLTFRALNYPLYLDAHHEQASFSRKEKFLLKRSSQERSNGDLKQIKGKGEPSRQELGWILVYASPALLTATFVNLLIQLRHQQKVDRRRGFKRSRQIRVTHSKPKAHKQGEKQQVDMAGRRLRSGVKQRSTLRQTMETETALLEGGGR